MTAPAYIIPLTIAWTIVDLLVELHVEEVAKHSRSRASRKGWRTKKTRIESNRNATTERLEREVRPA